MSKLNSEELILDVLSKKWPLRTKEIYSCVLNKKQITYQAVHKILDELVANKILCKSNGKYAIDLDYIIKCRRNWVAIEDNYKMLSPAVSTSNLSVPQSVFLFEKGNIFLDMIPSALISCATFMELLDLLTIKQLYKIAKNIALRDVQFFSGKYPDKTVSADKPFFIDKFKDLANNCLWGDLAYVIKDSGLEAKISSNLFITKKSRFFFETLNIEYLRLIGFRLINKNSLGGTFFFKLLKQRVQ